MLTRALKELFVALAWLLAIFVAMVMPVPFPYRWGIIGIVFGAAILELIREVRRGD